MAFDYTELLNDRNHFSYVNGSRELGTRSVLTAHAADDRRQPRTLNETKPLRMSLLKIDDDLRKKSLVTREARNPVLKIVHHYISSKACMSNKQQLSTH